MHSGGLPKVRFSLRAHPTTYILIGIFVAQLAFASWARKFESYWTVLPPAPTRQALAAQSFGDPEFLYRTLVMDLQNFGDTGGRSVALKHYDMRLVVQWLQALDHLDIDANHHLVLAARYFSQTQNVPDVEHLVRYIKTHVAQNAARKLQWLREAIFLAQVRLKNPALVLEVADQLAEYDFPAMSVIAYQLPALLYEKAGDFAAAARLMRQAQGRLEGRVRPDEYDYMTGYIARMEVRAAPAGRESDR